MQATWEMQLTLENCSEIVVDRAHLGGVQHAVDPIVNGRVQGVYINGTACVLIGCAALGTVADADWGQEDRHGSVHIHLNGYMQCCTAQIFHAMQEEVASAKREEFTRRHWRHPTASLLAPQVLFHLYNSVTDGSGMPSESRSGSAIPSWPP